MKQNSSDFNRNVVFNFLVFTGILSRFLFRETSEVPLVQKAYLDPGTGSMIISAIIGIFATVVLGFKTFGYKLARLFKSKPKESGGKNTDTPAEKP